jgi:hypothetical protein
MDGQEIEDAGTDARSTPEVPLPPDCGTSGACMSTLGLFTGALGGLGGADELCQAEYPGSHFYREGCDSGRNLDRAYGYADLDLGSCWDCDGWTSSNSGDYVPGATACVTGYARVGAVIPDSVCLDPSRSGHCWRICEARDKPLVCCTP